MKEIIKDEVKGYHVRDVKGLEVTTQAYSIGELIDVLIKKGVITEDDL